MNNIINGERLLQIGNYQLNTNSNTINFGKHFTSKIQQKPQNFENKF